MFRDALVYQLIQCRGKLYLDVDKVLLNCSVGAGPLDCRVHGHV
jgi:hypothetical protein